MLRFKRATILARSVYTRRYKFRLKIEGKRKGTGQKLFPKNEADSLLGGKAAGRKTTVSHLAVEIASCTLARTWCTVV